jgi:hypothetical protein
VDEFGYCEYWRQSTENLGAKVDNGIVPNGIVAASIIFVSVSPGHGCDG